MFDDFLVKWKIMGSTGKAWVLSFMLCMWVSLLFWGACGCFKGFMIPFGIYVTIALIVKMVTYATKFD